ncbi:hypothetical protein FIBSPDRAFT_312974 [Athelia psychrophila]|uniref:Uncharacterized protein n=1 Tax=Athelia psychrophila TaxID=1759441 RepID=A0A166WEI1_9AGAM|nr:hypothetical protein FIBSPDRAFT_312974 [Fibularhizoctonia sp. CBS 109695]
MQESRRRVSAPPQDWNAYVISTRPLRGSKACSLPRCVSLEPSRPFNRATYFCEPPLIIFLVPYPMSSGPLDSTAGSQHDLQLLGTLTTQPQLRAWLPLPKQPLIRLSNLCKLLGSRSQCPFWLAGTIRSVSGPWSNPERHARGSDHCMTSERAERRRQGSGILHVVNAVHSSELGAGAERWAFNTIMRCRSASASIRRRGAVGASASPLGSG